MPVSHLGLTVSHIPSATSFYLSTLQPLGYRFFGAQGDSIGLGVQEADFFLSQAKHGVRPTPTHVAFQAADCITVRDCFDAALRAGGRPSGRPGFRKDDCKCFNAAVEDLDGNTVEFIWRDAQLYQEPEMADFGGRTRAAYDSRPLPVRSKTQSIYTSSEAPRNTGLLRSRTEPVEGFSSKTLLGTMLGAAAGAAVAYAMVKSEKDGSRTEARYSAMWSRGRNNVFDQPRSHRRSASSAGESSARRHSAVEASRNGGMILPAPFADDNQVEYSRHRVSRTGSGKNERFEAVAVGPGSFGSRRSKTMPVEHSRGLLLDDKHSQHSSRRGSLADTKSRRHDSVVSSSSRRSYYTAEPPAYEPSRYDLPKYSSASQASTIKPPRRGSLYAESAAQYALPPSKATSRASTRVSRSRESERFDAYYLPVNTPNDALRADQLDDDGLDDMRTIVPDDSISCIDLPKSYSGSRSRKYRSSTKTRSQYSSVR